MLNKALIIVFIFIISCTQTSVFASTTRIDFSGILTFGTISNLGTFSGVLVADWNNGSVYEYYADVSYSTGRTERYSVFPNYDLIEVIQGSIATQYWSDGTVKQYSVSYEKELNVRRFQRGLNDILDVGPDPDWSMVLEIAPRGIWVWSDDEYQIIPCSSPSGFCWDNVSSFNVVGKITSLTTTTVPIPAAVWFFVSGMLGFIGIVIKNKTIR